MLCGLDVVDNRGQYEKELDDIIVNIPRLIPYNFNMDARNYSINNQDGLLEYKDEIPWLHDEYKTILQNNIDFLEKVKKIRNKLEHRMHNVVPTGGCTGNGDFFVTFSVKGNEIRINDSELIGFAKEMNTLFSRLQKHIGEIANKEGVYEHVYCKRMFRYDFLNFNKIYESDLLYVFGKALFPF